MVGCNYFKIYEDEMYTNVKFALDLEKMLFFSH